MAKEKYREIDKFDRLLGALADLPDVSHVKPSTIVTHEPLIGAARTFIVQTYRQKEAGDTIFLQYIDDEGSTRIAIPPAVADAIARQRDALTTKSRKRAAREQAQLRKAQGKAPAFLKTRTDSDDSQTA